MSKPLRILVILSFPWDARLGASQVWMELAAQWTAVGHSVEKFSLSDAFPDGAGSGPQLLINQLRFTYKARAFVRENAHRFDVIDAFIGALPFPKLNLDFGGLLVARSVGLHRFYDEFEKSIARRWPQQPRGRFSGRLFYKLARRQLLRASEYSLSHADVINVPNEAEAEYLRNVVEKPERVIAQPYGLTDMRRDSLAAAAAPAEVRLAEQRICFVGMWSARKGAHDWPRIVSLIRAEVPGARFTFLGTMVDAGVVRHELGDVEGIEVISTYNPDQLPELLSQQTVGAFPSYVEGFGLALLEQLAAGIPTVAFDADGPREILAATFPELLVPAGDLDRFASAVVRVLRSDFAEYQRLAQRSVEQARKFSWSAIAGSTVAIYRQRLTSERSLIFVQPFALSSAGGGARILRALIDPSPLPITVVCTSPEPPQPATIGKQLHIPLRPFLGRVERTRLSAWPDKITPLARPAFRRRLRAAFREGRALGVHAIPHAGLDFHDSYSVARELGLPFFLQVHDDILYSAKGRVGLAPAGEAMREVWTGADVCFVISQRLGEEYCRRYGAREFVTVTDGIETVAAAPAAHSSQELRLYFMGLFHIGYEENLRVLLAALERLRELRPACKVSVTLRCGDLRSQLLRDAGDVRVLPLGSEGDVRADMANADLLYLPLPFGERFEHFTKLSLSTKLVTYLGTGIPILYHGPSSSAVFELLDKNDAALLQTNLAPETLAAALSELIGDPARRQQIAANALHLANRDFMIGDQRRKFWGALVPICEAA